MSLKYRSIYIFIIMLCFTLGVSTNLFSQGKKGFLMYKDERGIERSLVRKVLNKFSLTITTGYGRTFYSHDVDQFSLLQKGNNLYIIENSELTASGPNTGYSSWMTDPQYTEGLFTGADDVLINTDTADISFKAKGTSIPLMLSLHYNINRFRLGLGFAVEYHIIKTYSPDFNVNYLNNYEESTESTLQTKFFGTVGARIYDYWDYSFIIDAQFGKHNRGGAFNKNVMEQGLYFNVGLPIEKNLSEYFRLVLRPSYEFSNYTINLPESLTPVKHKTPAFFVQAGVSLTFPEIPRCPIKSCHTQMKHVHFGREYRGQPLPKKQNPGYGENHPELEMYKGRKKGERNKL